MFFLGSSSLSRPSRMLFSVLLWLLPTLQLISNMCFLRHQSTLLQRFKEKYPPPSPRSSRRLGRFWSRRAPLAPLTAPREVTTTPATTPIVLNPKVLKAPHPSQVPLLTANWRPSPRLDLPLEYPLRRSFPPSIEFQVPLVFCSWKIWI